MKLIDEWKLILKNAWSVRLAILSGLFSAIEVVLPMFSIDIPRGVFAGLSGITGIAAAVSRFLVQKSLTKPNGD